MPQVGSFMHPMEVPSAVARLDWRGTGRIGNRAPSGYVREYLYQAA